MSKSPQDCPQWDSCSAPLCPLDEESLKHGVFYPDEPICTSKKFGSGKLFIKNQRKIAKKIKQENMDTYFTHQMLSRKFKIGKGIKGIDPDRKEEPQMEKWFRDHPVFEPSEKQKMHLEEIQKKSPLFKGG